MPRTSTRCSRKAAKITKPLDIIDLTQDSPINPRLSGSCTARLCEAQDSEIGANDESESIILVNSSDETLDLQMSHEVLPDIVINLEDTIQLDEPSNNSNMNKNKSVLANLSNENRVLTCTVCFENLADENIKPMTTPCGHLYCYDCLKAVCDTRKKCSICQRKILFGKCIQLYI